MKFLNKQAIEEFLYNSDIMNWTNLNKSILILALGGIDFSLWLFWCLFTYYTPSLQHWINVDYFPYHITVICSCIVVFFLLILPCHYLKHHKIVQTVMPYIVILFFGCAFIRGGYTIGVMSPATIAGFISMISVGLVLLDRKVIYSIFLPITIYLLVTIYFSAMGELRYAPLFSEELNHTILIQNSFWVWSMLYLYIPIFFGSIVLFEILLIQWRNREKIIHQISQLDPLTGIYNRRSISQNLNTIQEDEHNYALVLLDLDHFKQINDNYGHDVGDRVLKQVAKILSANLRDHDVVGRFGGEEFILILQEKELIHALEIAERCRKEIEKETVHVTEQESVHISASFGIAMSEKHLSKEAVIRLADEALYYAKANGRNQVRHYSEIING